MKYVQYCVKANPSGHAKQGRGARLTSCLLCRPPPTHTLYCVYLGHSVFKVGPLVTLTLAQFVVWIRGDIYQKSEKIAFVSLLKQSLCHRQTPSVQWWIIFKTSTPGAQPDHPPDALLGRSWAYEDCKIPDTGSLALPQPGAISGCHRTPHLFLVFLCVLTRLPNEHLNWGCDFCKGDLWSDQSHSLCYRRGQGTQKTLARE